MNLKPQRGPPDRHQSRLDLLRDFRDFIDHEIALALGPSLSQGAENPLAVAVANLYEVNPEHIISGGRGHRVTRARHSLAWLLHRDGMSLEEIAHCLGYTDATSVRYALRQVTARGGTRTLLLALPEVANNPHAGQAHEVKPEEVEE